MRSVSRREVVDGSIAGLIAAILSGIPSTIATAFGDRDFFRSTEAIGEVLLSDQATTAELVTTGIAIHLGISLFWGVVLALALPRDYSWGWGALAGLLIGFVDLVVIGQRFASIRALPLVPQMTDHFVFGLLVGLTLQWRRARRTS